VSKVCLVRGGRADGRGLVGVIDRSAIDGQKQYHKDLEKAMRKHIAAHRAEFVPKGAAAAALANGEEPGDELVPSEAGDLAQTTSTKGPGIFTTVTQIASPLFEGAFSQLKGMRTTNALAVLVVVLALSNLWSFLGPRAEPRVPGDAQSLKKKRLCDRPGLERVDTRMEIKELRRSMEAIEKRLARIEEALGELD
jgi:hypothetical protein